MWNRFDLSRVQDGLYWMCVSVTNEDFYFDESTGKPVDASIKYQEIVLCRVSRRTITDVENDYFVEPKDVNFYTKIERPDMSDFY